MSEISTQNLCGVKTADGTPCQRRVKPGSGPCAWHVNTFGQKIRAWARNNTLVFVLTLIFGVFGVVGTCGWIYDEFFKSGGIREDQGTDSVTATVQHPSQPLLESAKPPVPSPDIKNPTNSTPQIAPPIKTKKTNPPVKSPNESVPPAFAVAVELKLLVPSGIKDEAGTGFWGVSAYGGNCFLRSADIVMLIRIKKSLD
jgi:hypothetical protein